MAEYTVVVGFVGFIGVEQEYTVEANSRDEAEAMALQEAMDDLTIESVEETEEDE